jgi:IMP dehydrogenase
MGYDFTTFPVVDQQNRFIGIVSSDSFRYTEDTQTTVGQAMKPAAKVTTAPVDTSLEEAYQIMLKNKINTLPLVSEDLTVKGLYLFSDAQRVHLDRHAYNVDTDGQLYVAAAVSAGSSDLMDRVDRLSKYVDAIVLDTADGDSYYAFRSLQQIKEKHPKLDVVVGNITTGKSAYELAQAGADGIKVGQGGGSICVTRPETGIGIPQVSAVFDCIRALEAKFPHIPVNSDGGIKNHGDIGIAMTAGAHSVMMGRMLAGTREAPGNVITRKDGSVVKEYRGMGSADALQDNEASRLRYGVKPGGLILPEGVVSQVPFEGAAADVLGVCALALRKTMRYVKAPSLRILREEATFTRITNNGLRESHPHDVQVV